MPVPECSVAGSLGCWVMYLEGCLYHTCLCEGAAVLATATQTSSGMREAADLSCQVGEDGGGEPHQAAV